MFHHWIWSESSFGWDFRMNSQTLGQNILLKSCCVSLGRCVRITEVQQINLFSHLAATVWSCKSGTLITWLWGLRFLILGTQYLDEPLLQLSILIVYFVWPLHKRVLHHSGQERPYVERSYVLQGWRRINESSLIRKSENLVWLVIHRQTALCFSRFIRFEELAVKHFKWNMNHQSIT